MQSAAIQFTLYAVKQFMKSQILIHASFACNSL